MVVLLPLPLKHLSPNARCHWAAKAKAVKTYRAFAWAAAISAGLKNKQMESAAVECKFYFGRRGRRDSDNLLASMKAAFDGLVDAGVFTDDSGLTHLPVVQEIDRENPRVEIHIKTEGN